MKRRKYIYFYLLSALMLILSTPGTATSIIVFFALIPILFLEFKTNENRRDKLVFLACVYLVYVFWNLFSNSWIFDTSLKAGLLVCLLNPLVQITPWAVIKIFNLKSEVLKWSLFVSSWLTMEIMQMTWAFGYPMLNLGNSLGHWTSFIQFYEYSGVLGGTLWILLVNIFCLQVIFFYSKKNIVSIKSIFKIVFLSIPYLISLFLYPRTNSSQHLTKNAIEIVVIHPNNDVRNDKYNMAPLDLVVEYLNLSEQLISDETRLVVWPENAITSLGLINDIGNSRITAEINEFFQKYPNLSIVSGAIVYEQVFYKVASGDVLANARFDEVGKNWYYTYNSAVQFSANTSKLFFRSKEKLVPVEETIPYTENLSFLREILHSLGGYSFSKREKNNDLFYLNGIAYTPLICYESSFSTFFSGYSKKGAEFFIVMLNEGWYKNLFGARQFQVASQVRAIENRRDILRSSNQGISSHINMVGEVNISKSKFSPTGFSTKIIPSNKKTFYSKFAFPIIYSIYLSTLFLLIISLVKKRTVNIMT